MRQFRYKTIEASGRVVTGAMEAASEADVIERLRQGGGLPVRVDAAQPGIGGRRLLARATGREHLGRQEAADFTRELATMLQAGQDLDRSLRFLSETARGGRLRAVVLRLRDAVRGGRPLGAALAQEPGSFSEIYIGLVRAGEAGGTLAATLEGLAVLLERQRALAATITSALIYPALLTVVAAGAIVLLLTQVLPQFVPLFQQSGASLPGSTQFLIDAGDFLGNWGAALLAAALSLGLSIRYALRVPAVGLATERLILRLPIAGGLKREILAARFARTLGTLLLNGVPLVAALGITRDAIGSPLAASAVERSAAGAKGGAGLAGSLETSGVFPLRTIYLLRLGEETGQLGTMSLRAAEVHEERTRIGVQRLVSLLVPVIIIVMGGAVGGIVYSLLVAMLSLNDLAQ